MEHGSTAAAWRLMLLCVSDGGGTVTVGCNGSPGTINLSRSTSGRNVNSDGWSFAGGGARGEIKEIFEESFCSIEM